MPNFQDSFKTRKQSFISALLIFMTVPLIKAMFFFHLKPFHQLRLNNNPLLSNLMKMHTQKY